MNPARLINKWVRAYEEDTDDELVYRSADVDLPPARGREFLEIQSDGSFTASHPGADDRPEAAEPGSWRLEGNTVRMSGAGAGSSVPSELVVTDVEKNKLVVKRSAR